MKPLLIFLVCCLGLSLTGISQPIQVNSPDGKNVIEVYADNELYYSVKRNGDLILSKSPLAMNVGGKVWGNNMKYKKIREEGFNEKVDFIVPRKYKTTQNNYNKLTLTYKEYKVEFRAYNDGIAYRFIGTKDKIKPVIDETICYNFSENYKTYTLLTNKLQNWYEENYTIKELESLPRDSFSITPVMVEADKYKLLLAEANLVNYPGMYLQASGTSFKGILPKYPTKEDWFDGDNKIYATEREGFLVNSTTKRNYPWRVMGIFDNEIHIISSELIYLLSDEKAGDIDYSWIKPGKALWDWWNDRNIYNVSFISGINTGTYKYLIDYASEHGLEYVLIDEGWSERNDLMKLNPDVDIPFLSGYAKSKDVGLMLWAKWINVDKQMDIAFAQFEEWGIKGIKIDFMDRNDTKMVNFYHRVAQKATEHKLLVNFHGSYPNKGMRRKYPNVMTREGVIGLEYNKWSKKATVTHDVIIPYLRMWLGPMDYTPGAMLNAHPETFYFNQHEPMSQGTRSHQLAMYVVYESPLQMVSDSPSKYDENPESFEFIKETPAVWDETIPIAGEIGEYIVVARKSGDKWFVGAINGETPRDIEIDLSFTGNGEKVIKVHSDGVNAFQQAKDFEISTVTVDNNHKVKIGMARGGGYVGIIENLK